MKLKTILRAMLFVALPLAIAGCDGLLGGDDGDNGGGDDGTNGGKNDPAVMKLIGEVYDNYCYRLERVTIRSVNEYPDEHTESTKSIDRSAQKSVEEWWGKSHGFEFVRGNEIFHDRHDTSFGHVNYKAKLHDLYWPNYFLGHPVNAIQNYSLYNWKKDGDKYIGTQFREKEQQTGRGESTETVTVELTPDLKNFLHVYSEQMVNNYDGSFAYRQTSDATFSYEAVDIQIPNGMTEDSFTPEEQIKITVNLDGKDYAFYTSSTWGEGEDKTWQINPDSIVYEFPAKDNMRVRLYLDAAFTNAVPFDGIAVKADTKLYGRYEEEMWDN